MTTARNLDPTTTTGVATANDPTDVRSRLLAGTAALIVVQLVHLLDVLRYVPEASFPGVLADPLAAVGIGLATFAFVLLVARRPSARRTTIVAALAVAAGVLLHHGIPFDLGTNNPYWTFDEGNRADVLRWATVVVLIALGAWTAATAWRSSTIEGA